MKHYRLLIITLITIIFLNSSTFAQGTLKITIDQAISIGIENSKSLHSSLMKVQYADAKSSETDALLLPSLKFGGSYTKLSTVPPFDMGPFPPLFPGKVTISPSVFDNYNLHLTLQQPLFMGFRLRSSAHMAEYYSQAAERDYQKDKAELVYNVKSAYWSLFKANEFEKVIDENVAQIKTHLKDVQNFYAQGIVTKNEVLKVEVQLSNVEVLQIDARNNVLLAAIALNSLIGLPLDTKIEFASTPQHQTIEYGDVGELVKKSLDYRPDVKAMELRVKASESSVTLARSGWFPQIALVGNYIYARPNQRIFPTKDEFKDTWDISISASFDIWNWGTTIHQTDEAQAQLAQAQDGLAQLKDGITLEVTQNYLNLNQTKERIVVAEKGVGQAEENYRITNEKFKSGLVLNSDLLDAEVALLQTKFNQIQSLIDYELADARLRKAIGDDTVSR